MKIGLVVPTRGRKKFLEFSLEHLLRRQTLKPDYVEVISRKSIYPTGIPDVTWRYRIGIEKLKENKVDLILFWEDDDWYSPKYIEVMVRNWIKGGKPDLLGINKTIYYHIFLKKYVNLVHKGRASAMSMGLSKEYNPNWCQDTYPYLDYYIWTKDKTASRQLFSFDFEKPLCIGIKHGIGMVGGAGHKRFRVYKEEDKKMEHFKGMLQDDYEALTFYRNLKHV